VPLLSISWRISCRQDWNLPHITDYWDQRVGAIERLSRLFTLIRNPEFNAEKNALYDAVTRQADALADKDLIKFAVPMVDDLYKAINQRTQCDEADLVYLEASAALFSMHSSSVDTWYIILRTIYLTSESPASSIARVARSRFGSVRQRSYISAPRKLLLEVSKRAGQPRNDPHLSRNI
jgi:hypothetical protein